MQNRTAIAFATAPLPAVAITVLVWYWIVGPHNVKLVDLAAIFAMAALSVYTTAFIGGLPVWAAFRMLKIRSPLPFVLAGALLGVAAVLVMIALGLSRPSGVNMTFLQDVHRTISQRNMTEMAIAGAVAGLAFWWIAIRTPTQPQSESDHSGT